MSEEFVKPSDLRRIEDSPAIRKPQPKATVQSGRVFEKTLASQIQEHQPLTFSAHAMERLQKRNIQLSPQHLEKLNQAVSKLQAKGAKESLVLMDDMALIVGIKHKTVITAMDKASMKGNIITNIDSAIYT